MRGSPILMASLGVALLSCSGLPFLRAADPTPGPADARMRSVGAFLADCPSGLTAAQIERVSRVVVEEADRTGFTPGLIAALIHVESSGRHRAISRVGALGLMQLRPETARGVAERLGIEWRGPQMLFDPEINVRLGIHYLAELFERFGDIELALAAYNWGPTWIAEQRQAERRIPRAYTRRVLGYYRRNSREIGLG